MPQRSVSSLLSSHSVRGGECFHVCHALQVACCALTPKRRAIHHPFGSNMIICIPQSSCCIPQSFLTFSIEL